MFSNCYAIQTDQLRPIDLRARLLVNDNAVHKLQSDLQGNGQEKRYTLRQADQPSGAGFIKYVTMVLWRAQRLMLLSTRKVPSEELQSGLTWRSATRTSVSLCLPATLC
jgi:hypothetical protein